MLTFDSYIHNLQVENDLCEINYFDIENKCRTCSKIITGPDFALSKAIKEDSLYELCNLEVLLSNDKKNLRLIDILEELIGIKISLENNLPKRICFPCKTDLIKSYTFWLQCHTSHKKFMNMVNVSQCKTNETINKYNETFENNTHLNNFENPETFNFEEIIGINDTDFDLNNFLNSDTELDSDFFLKLTETTTAKTENNKTVFECINNQEILNSEKVNLNNLNCPYCEEMYSELLLKQHLKNVHLKNELHKCQICNKTFRQLSSVKRHEKFVHILSNDNGRKFKLCVICKSYFKNMPEYKQHISEHFSKGNQDGKSSKIYEDPYFKNFNTKFIKKDGVLSSSK